MSPSPARDKFQQEWGNLPTEKGLSLPEMVEAAKAGKLKALYVVGSNPVGRLGIDPFAFSKSFVVVQDMFLTETANIADVVLPAANAYEKTGTYTNTCGDLQLVKKAGEVTDTKPDFEMIVRIADAMGFDVQRSGALRQRDALRHGPDARRAVGRSGSARGVARSAQPGTEDDALRSHGDSRRNPARGCRIRYFAGQSAGGQRSASRDCRKRRER